MPHHSNFFKPTVNTSISMSEKLTAIVGEITDREGWTVSGFIEQAVIDHVLRYFRKDPIVWELLYKKFFS